MRTTVTLEPDVEKLLRESMERGRKSFKQALNEAVRRGLIGRGSKDEEPFVLEARALRLRAGIDAAALRDIDTELEEEELLRKTRVLVERNG
ncbi:MAG TPA: antitoxin [Thermoanaerobaculia bacterium]|nr:antitoxin [Thermoanaerobaculia bacterium]